MTMRTGIEHPADGTMSPVIHGDGTGTTLPPITLSSSNATITFAEDRGAAWQGPLAIEGTPTADGRLLIRGEISERDLPIPLMVQLQTGDGHEDAFNAGRIEAIEHIPIAEVNADVAEEFGLDGLPDHAVVIWGTGTFDRSEYADEARRMLSNGCGISLDLSRSRVALFDADTLEEVDDTELSLEDILLGNYLEGFGGKIGGATIVGVAAFEEASIKIIEDQVLVASAAMIKVEKPMTMLTAAAGPLKPPREWFDDPRFTELTPLTITKDGQIFGHLCDWDGCHIGFQGICVPPFRSPSNYAVFNASCGAGIETSTGETVQCGKLLYSRDGSGHAPTDPNLTYQEVQGWYDDSTKVAGYVRAGADRFGTYLVGSLRSDLSEIDIQHIRTHPPSGDWRPVKGVADLVAAFGVPVGGFPIVSRQALVASANGEITAVITAPLELTADDGARRRRRQMIMLSERLVELVGTKESPRAAIRRKALELDMPAENLGP